MLRIVGRSSSHFTRIARLFANELAISYDFTVVHDLFSQNGVHYADNPALKIPVLMTEDGPWFGALNICRALTRRASSAPMIVWPEQITDRRAANAQELVLQGMATEVGIIMRGPGTPDAHDDKARESLVRSVAWLDAELPAALASLPPSRTTSFLEVSVYCFVTHLAFRQVLETDGYEHLQAFCSAFGQRASARATAYRFDDAPASGQPQAQ